MNQNNERLLLLDVAGGNEAAFKELFESWYPFLAAHIFRITESRELTQEIVQDVFLKIWLTRETLAEIDNFKAYLIVVSRNHALNSLRKIARESRNYSQWLSEKKFEEHPDPSSMFYSLIDEAIDQLTARQREIYLMQRHERMTYQEIADHLHVSRETVKSHLKSATAAITKFINEKMNIIPVLIFFWNFF